MRKFHLTNGRQIMDFYFWFVIIVVIGLIFGSGYFYGVFKTDNENRRELGLRMCEACEYRAAAELRNRVKFESKV